MRVTILGVNYAPEVSGIAPYTTGLAEGLVAHGHRVEVFTAVPHYPSWRAAGGYSERVTRQIINGVGVTRFRPYIPTQPNNITRAAFEISFGRFVATANWASPDVLVCVSPALLSSGIAVARARLWRERSAIGLWIQDLYSRGVEETGHSSVVATRAIAALEGTVVRGCDGVAVIHDRFKSIVTRFGVPAEQVRVIRNWTHMSAVEDFDVRAFRAQQGWRPDEVIVLHAGALGIKQGLDNVVCAARCAESDGLPVRFVLLGDGSQRRRLEEGARGVRSLQFVNPMGAEDFGRALRAADVLLVNEKPGVTDMAVPSKLTSYMSSGRPILAATDSGSTTAEEIDLSAAGVRVSAGSPRELLAAVLRLAGNPVLAEKLGRNGLRYCSDVLSKERAIAQLDRWVSDLACLHRRLRE